MRLPRGGVVLADPGFGEAHLVGPAQDLEIPFVPVAQAPLRRVRGHGEKSEIHGVLLHSVRAGLLPAAVRCRRDLRLDGHSLPLNRSRRKMRTAPPVPRTSEIRRASGRDRGWQYVSIS